MHSTTLPSPSAFDIYKASAGSGKTFRLTINYLKLVLQHAHAFKQIQAVTFTNKATAEMKERILHVLHQLADNATDTQTNGYRRQILLELPSLTENALTQKARDAYAAILHDYSRFHISTIDAFVQRIIRSFSWELGIDGGFRLQLAVEPVKEALTDKLYQLLDNDPALLQWMVTVATERLEEGKSWNIRESLLSLADEIFKEQFQQFDQGLRQMNDDEIDAAFKALRTAVYSTKKSIEKKWQDEAEKLLKFIDESNLVSSDFYYKGEGITSYFQKVANGDISAPGSRIQYIIDNPNKLAGNGASPAAKQAIAALQDSFVASCERFNNWSNTDLVEYNTAVAISKKLDQLRLVKTLAEQLSAYRSEENALLMTDIHALLRELTRDATVPFIYEKTGQQFKHYLIDEFQDTSRFQWQNFKPLIEESLATQQYSMVVGDVKQAIYRWRNGDWRLLLSEVANDLQAHHPAEKTLQDNYRSSQQIIAFNNLLFLLAPQIMQQQLNALMHDAGEATSQAMQAQGYGSIFERAYADAFQQTPDGAPDNGLVTINWIEAENDGDFADHALLQLSEKINELLQEGFQPADIAVLVRKNDEAKAVVEYLIAAQRNAGQPYDVVSGDALLLQNNIAIRMLLCAMNWMANEQDSLAKAEFIYLHQLILLKEHEADTDLLQPGDGTAPPYNYLLPEMALLKGLPVNQLLHELIMLLSLNEHDNHAAFVMAFADAVQSSMQYGETNLHQFLKYWKDEGYKKALPVSGGSNAVEVLTIHRSKGLDFTVVLMPFINWSIQPKSNSTYLVSTAHTSFSQIPMVALPYSKTLANSDFAPFYFEEFVLTAMDNMNMLYVACTRARQRIYGWAKDKGKDKEIKHTGHLLQHVASSIEPIDERYTDTRSAYASEKQQWTYGHVATPEKKKHIVTAEAPQLIFSAWRSKISVRYKALQTEAESATLLPRDQGLLLHDALQRMHTPKDVEKVLQNMLRNGTINERQQPRILTVLNNVLQLPALQPWHQSDYKRLAEQPMLSNERQLRRADLILYSADETAVYDFKFTESRAKQTTHEQQIKQYMQMLSQIGFPNVQGHIIYGYQAEAVAVLP